MFQMHDQGITEVGTAAMGSGYTSQIYYDLNGNLEVSSNGIAEWDLCFESTQGGWLIRLNSSKFMHAGNSNDTLFSSLLNEEDLEMVFDASSGNIDSTAIGTWFTETGDSIISLRNVYLVDRGINELNKAVGFKKVQFDVKGNSYLIRYADPDNQNEVIQMIERGENSNRVYFSFENGILEIAPESEQWSLLFSRYTTMLLTTDGEKYPYLVAGVILNPNGVAAALDTIHDFMEMEINDTIDLELSTRSDLIGYDWKYYDFDAAIYTIVPEYMYVLRDRDGFYYKLRFIDFYNSTGEKGYPNFEFIRL